jgi:phage protein D
MAETDAIKAARPTIAIEGRDDASLAEGLLGLLVAETVAGLYRCELLVGNWGTTDGSIGFLYFDRQLLDFGKAVRITLGNDVIFDGRITGLEANFPNGQGPELNVLAEDRFQDLRMTRRTQTFSDVSDADVITRIANDHGLRPNVSVSGPTHKVLAQINQSDLAFVRERARAVDAELWMDGSMLNAKAHGDRDGGTLELTYRQELREFSVLSDLAAQRSSVTVAGWDVGGKRAVKFEATASAIASELNGDESGASILSAKFGDRKEALAHTVPLSSREAQAEAEALFKMSARRFVTGRGIAETDGRLRVGSYVDLKNLGPLYSGKYYVSEVTHLFDGTRGIRTEFKAERPGLGRRG